MTVEVTNKNEPGDVSLSASQPRIGVDITAMVDSDADGGVSGVTWQWQVAETNAACRPPPTPVMLILSQQWRWQLCSCRG